MRTLPGFPDDEAPSGAYRARFWSFAWPTPLLVGAIGGIMWMVGETDMARAMWLYAVLQALLLVGFLVRPSGARLFARLTLYSYVFFSFAVVLLFGGILRSGGVVFVGLAGALFALTFLGLRHFRILSALFFLTILLEVILQPYVPAPATLGEPANHFLFVAHLLVVAQVVFQTISQYVRQNLAAKQQEAERLKQLDSLKSDFYTRITHEFRTPLTVILGMAQQIRSAPEQYARSGAEMIRQSGTRLLNLVKQMLDLGKLESGQMELHPEQADIRSFLEYLVEPFQWLAEAHDVQLQLTMGPEALLMDHDPEKTESLVSNLLSNALKHAPEGSDVEVRVMRVDRLPDPGKGTYCLFAPENVATGAGYLQIGIRDSGSGISREHMPDIFERYKQLQDPSLPEPVGSGIGLAIVRELLALLGGQLHLESEPGQGSLFTIFLPITRNAPPAGESRYHRTAPVPVREGKAGHAEQAPAVRKAHKVLIIEDNAGVVQYLRTILGNEYQLEVAEDGEQGVARALEGIPDLIITDIMMPKQDGYALSEQLKQDIRTSHIPIIMLTARADRASRLQGLARGADDYLLKPFDPDELKVRIGNLLRTREKLRHRYQLNQNPVRDRPRNQSLDDQFIHRVNAVLRKHLDDEQFGTELLARAMHMSRTQLFRKLKALTGHSASQVIRQFRMEKAKALVLQSDLQISEIAYAVGFKDPAYFSKVFARSFGQAPTELRQKRDVPF